MFFEIIGNQEALLEIRVEVILDLLSSSDLYPLIVGFRFLIHEANGVRVTLTEAIDVFQVSARYEQLNFVAHMVRRGESSLKRRILYHPSPTYYHWWLRLRICPILRRLLLQ